ncbi:MAG: DNA polymerase III subunit delta [Epsilonproteobacteria bacterium]|nr:DNA polymerase III subunit delta [Campylobacterota bacterium]
MYKREFENLLNSSKLPKSMLLHGACFYQTNLYGEKIVKNLGVQAEEKLLLYYDEYNFTVAQNFLSQSSLFGDRNILIVKTDKVIPKKELDVLVELSFKNSTNHFIYQYFGDDKKARSIAKSFTPKKSANFVRFFKLNQGEAIYLLDTLAKDMGINISRYALSHLYMLQNEDISLCANDLKKLKIFDKEIQISDVDEFIYGLGTVGMDNFIYDLLQKKDIKEGYLKLIEFGSADEIRIINAIESYVSQLFLFHIYIRINGRFDVKAILGYPLPPNLAQERSKLCMMINLKTYDEIFKLLLNCEFKLKKMQKIDKNSLLLSTLIKLQTSL